MKTSTFNFCPPIIAHRGACCIAPENTLSAFTKAAQLGVKWIECDVMQTADGKPIIFHDETLERTTNGSGALDAHSYAYLQTLDAGGWFDPIFSGERIPTLQQTLEFLQRTKMFANIEIKSLPGDEESLVKNVLKEMDEFLKTENSSILFSSFSVAALQHLRALAPQSYLGLLLHEWEPNWQTICTDLQCVAVHVNQEIMTQSAAQIIKKMNKLLLCYTVNDPARAKELYSWGVDAVFSDVPDKILSGLGD